jgi:hypothetical protein
MAEDDKLKQAFQRAAEISKSVPAALQEAAFNRALDALLPKSSREQIKDPKPRRGGRGSRRKGSEAKNGQAPVAKKQGARKTSGRLGPKAALEELLQTTFWSQPRTIGQLQEHLKTTRGHTFKITDLSPALVRLLREKKLERTKNKDNQYEYKRR